MPEAEGASSALRRSRDNCAVGQAPKFYIKYLFLYIENTSDRGQRILSLFAPHMPFIARNGGDASYEELQASQVTILSVRGSEYQEIPSKAF